jgi:hypothetical protein
VKRSEHDIREAVIHPDPEEVNKVVGALMGDVPPEEAKAQLGKSKVKVSHGPHDILKKVPGSFGAVGPTGDVYVSPAQSKSRHILNYGLPHELIHREQVKRMGPAGEPYVDRLINNLMGDVKANRPMDMAKYGKIPQEQMAWAHTIVNGWRNYGMNTEEILQRLREGDISPYNQVFADPASKRRLLAYAYQYAQHEAA